MFTPDRSKKNGFKSQCKPCVNEAKRTTDKDRERDRAAKLRREYGLSAEEYEEMLEEQDGECAICHNFCSSGRRLAVDHCHSTGKVRGLLCGNCNTGLGKFEDSIERLQRAIEYLQQSREGQV